MEHAWVGRFMSRERVIMKDMDMKKGISICDDRSWRRRQGG